MQLNRYKHTRVSLEQDPEYKKCCKDFQDDSKDPRTLANKLRIDLWVNSSESVKKAERVTLEEGFVNAEGLKAQ